MSHPFPNYQSATGSPTPFLYLQHHNQNDEDDDDNYYYDEHTPTNTGDNDSLAYSDITGEPRLSTSFSGESLRLNGHYSLPPTRMLPTTTSSSSRRAASLYPFYGDRMALLRHTTDSQSSAAAAAAASSRGQPPSSYWLHQPKIRICFGLSVLSSLITVFLLTSGAIDSEWLENVWELGLHGVRAQGMADASLIKIGYPSESLHLGSGGTSGTSGTSGGNSSSKHAEQLELTSTPPNGCETTIMLIRHCEKGNLKSHCNYHGFERAAYLETLFGDHHDERWPAPTDLYALKAGGRGHKKNRYNFREVETVDRIASKLSLDINTDYQTKDHKKLSRRVLTSILNGEQCGKLTLISWKHSDIPKLAQLFGCGPMEGCPMDYRGKEFDQVWQIKYVYRSFHHGPKAKSSHKHWDIFGSVQYEHFDPLAFSKIAGDYPPGGTDHGAHWAAELQPLYD